MPSQLQWRPRAAFHELPVTPAANEAAFGPVQLELQRGGQAAPIASLPACSASVSSCCSAMIISGVPGSSAMMPALCKSDGTLEDDNLPGRGGSLA